MVRSELVEKAARIRTFTRTEFDALIRLRPRSVRVLAGPRGARKR